MSLLMRKKVKSIVATNDFSTLTWDSLAVNIDKAETLVGKNAQLRYGIATETDTGLDESKFILVPTVDEWKDDKGLNKMYTSEVLMSGIHMVADANGNPITENFPENAKFRKLAEVEWKNRDKLEEIRCSDETGYDLLPGQNTDDVANLTFICAHLNYLQLKADYPTLPEGVILAGAHTAAMGYRTGILESHAGREFIFVGVTVGKNGGYKIRQIDPSYANRKNKVIKPNDDFPDGTLRMHDKLLELGLGLCIGAGTTHYMMNHTTGGNKMGGHNLKALTINNLYKIDPGHEYPDEQTQTSFIYNVTHPVNKRAVANLVLSNAKVNTWYKNMCLPSPSVMYSDTFMSYRQNLVPSGAHKAYIAALVLKDIADAGMAIFLPDIELGRKVVKIYNDIKEYGARAHVGSRYYTDEPVAISQGEIDSFLPLAAYYVQHRMSTSSLAGSPHLDPTTADSASAKWKAIVQATMRVGAFGAQLEQINAYLKVSGSQGYVVDLSTEEGIHEAVRINDTLQKSINSLFQ